MLNARPAELIALPQVPNVVCEIRTRFNTVPTRKVLHIWAKQGIRGVLLPTVMISGRRFTSAAAVREFIKQTGRQIHPKGKRYEA